MSKHEMHGGYPLGFFTGLGVGVAIFNMTNILIGDNPNVDTEQLQANNRDIAEQLEDSFEETDSLLLDPSDKSFTFETDNGEILEVCSGQYTVNDKVASMTGTIACTRTIESNS